MIRLIFTLLVVLSVSSLASAKSEGYRISPNDNFNFIAPNVTGESNLPETTGLIVFDTNQNSYYGKGNVAGASGWLQLSPPAGAGFVPAGTILPFAGTAAPAGYLLCDGTSYVRATYAALATVLGCGGSSCAYGAADSTHFNVPDLRGRFLRGVDSATGNDPDAGARTAIATGGNTGNNVGSLQADGLASHAHTSSNVIWNIAGSFGGIGAGTNLQVGNFTTDATGGNETRPKNVYVNYIIKN